MFFFKQKTAYELRISDWSSDVCSSDLLVDPEIGRLGDVDTARTLLTTASGRLCVISNTRRSGYGYDQRVEAFCSRGMLRAGNVRGDTVCTLTPDASTGAAILPGFPERYRDAYRAQIDHFADVVHGRRSEEHTSAL